MRWLMALALVLLGGCGPLSTSSPVQATSPPPSPVSTKPQPTRSPVAAAAPAKPGQCGPGVPDQTPCPDQPEWLYGRPTKTSGCQFRLASDGKALLPDPECSPGGRNAVLTRGVICSGQFRTGVYRNVSDGVKARVYYAYGIPVRGSASLPLAGGGNVEVSMRGGTRWEIDHIRSLEDQGTNGAMPGTPAADWNLGNLYPQPAEPAGDGFHQKDQVETYVRNELCDSRGNTFTLDDQQAEALVKQLVTDWTVIYRDRGAAVKALPPKQSNGDQEAD